SVWGYAKALSRIMTDKLYADDFETSNKFLEALGISKALVSQYCTAVKFVNDHDLNVNIRGIDENKVYAIASSKCDLYKLTDGMDVHEYIISHSVAEIKADIKALKSTVDVDAKEVPSDDKPAKAENKSESTVVGTADVVEFDLDGKHYAIPADVLAKYEVKES
ncbi:hypothetical protein, partial [Enterococcus faecium]|uniref:hypothetical protein n=1 Tax=Enterococcus faecium TaxID=1352 RepID=UPI003DA41DCF